MIVQGRVPLAVPGRRGVGASRSGKCAYLTTIADRVYAIDVADPAAPKIVDSMMTNARLVNDVMTTEDGNYGVFSREGASDRKNGIVIFDANDPCHPKPVSEYTETVTGGVHSSYVSQGHVYLTDDATGSMRVIDIRDPLKPREVGAVADRADRSGRYVHDVAVTDGLAYLSLLERRARDPGRGERHEGRHAGEAEAGLAVQVRSERTLRPRGSAVRAGARGTHTAWRHGNYVFVGDEVYASKPAQGLVDGNDLTFGRLQ